MVSTLMSCLLVFAGGGLGALSRFGVQNLGIFDQDKYYYTVAINISGCIIIGVLWALFNHWQVAKEWYLFLLTGYLGGYTTYSAFTLDAMQLVQNGDWLHASIYVAITLVGGLGGCALGLFLTQKLIH